MNGRQTRRHNRCNRRIVKTRKEDFSGDVNLQCIQRPLENRDRFIVPANDRIRLVPPNKLPYLLRIFRMGKYGKKNIAIYPPLAFLFAIIAPFRRSK